MMHIRTYSDVRTLLILSMVGLVTPTQLWHQRKDAYQQVHMHLQSMVSHVLFGAYSIVTSTHAWVGTCLFDDVRNIHRSRRLMELKRPWDCWRKTEMMLLMVKLIQDQLFYDITFATSTKTTWVSCWNRTMSMMLVVAVLICSRSVLSLLANQWTH